VLGIQRGLNVEAPVFPAVAIIAVILRLQFKTEAGQQAAQAEFCQNMDFQGHGKPPSEALPGSAWRTRAMKGRILANVAGVRKVRNLLAKVVLGLFRRDQDFQKATTLGDSWK
jgi:hypothetical protein